MPNLPLADLLTYYFIAINFCAFAAFGWDKARAESDGWRVREDTLVMFVVLGGIVGALAGRALFGHKTRKTGFREKLWFGFLLSAVLIGGISYLLASIPTAEERARSEALMATVHYSGCNAVRATGKASLHYGEPGYRSNMDGDGDGVACEVHSNW